MNIETQHTRRDSRFHLTKFAAIVALSVAFTLSGGNGHSVRAEQPAAESQPSVSRPAQFNVSDFGAKGDGVTDDTPSIQAAINAAAANAGGGEVVFPTGTYLLNSTSPSTHPWAYYNLQIESGVILRGEDGAKLLQGPGGRHPVLEDADGVRNSILAFGSDHQVIRFQNPAYNGGFYFLEATSAKSTTATLKAASEASNFKPGDYVAIYERIEGDVIPTETGRVVSVDTSTGQLALKEPLSRSFETPSIANVTHVATTNVGVKNLIIEGSEPLTVTETFGFIAEECHFINDTSIGGKNVVDFNMNTLNGFRFSRNRFTSIGPGHIVLEMTQRNSRHGLWEHNTIEMMQGGMGEYAADIQFLNNSFTIHPSDRTSVGLMIGGQDIVFRGNKVTCGRITGGEGWGCVLADCVGPGYDRYVGNIAIADNTFKYEGDGNQLTHLVARDTTFTGNSITVKGSSMGVRGEGPPPQTLTISDNTFKMGTGHAVFLASYGVDGSTVTGNTISGSGAYGIYVTSPDKPATGKHAIHDNKIDGYRESLFIDQTLHPQAVLTAPVSSTARIEESVAKLPEQPTLSEVAGETASAADLQGRFTVYDFAEKAVMRPPALDRDIEYVKSWRLAIPKGVTTVKGILVVANCMGGDSRDWYMGGTAYEEFCLLHDFAFVGSEGFGPHYQNYDAFLHALASWATSTGHAELVHAPYVATGVSAGGGFASTLVTKCPEKVIAAVPQCARLNLTVFELKRYDERNPVPVPDAVLRVPVLDMQGDGQLPYMADNLKAHRPSGALYSRLVQWGVPDAYVGQEVLAMPYLEAALKLRYPAEGDLRKGPLKLKDLDSDSGWIADGTTWKSSLTSIYPALEFDGDIKQSSWLMNEDLAFIYRAYATANRPLKITSPAPQGNVYTPAQAADASVTIHVDASSLPGWKKLEFYDGAKLLGTVTSRPTQFKATNLTPGFHTFSVLGTDAAGNVRTSDCTMVVVRK